MNETIAITTEQINDLPLLLGIVEELGIRQRIDAQILWGAKSPDQAASRW
jgi:hypothetical protein